MGSYLKIYGYETNSGVYSGIIIDAVRLIDKRFQEIGTKKEKKYFVPGYYNENHIGCGNWKVKIKGMICLAAVLKRQRDECEDLVAKDNIAWCYDYVIIVLADMVYNGVKKVKLKWE